MPLSPRFFRDACITSFGVLLVFVACWAASTRWLVVAKWMLVPSVAIFVSFSVAILVLAFRPRKLEQHLNEDIKRGASGDFYLVGTPLVLLTSFLLTAFCLWRVFGADLFEGGSTRPFAWFVYLLDNLIRSACLDFAESFRLRISPIRHTTQFWVCLLIFTFRTTVSVALVSVVFRSWGLLRRRRLRRLREGQAD